MKATASMTARLGLLLALGAPALAGEHAYETDAQRVPAFQTGGSAWIHDVTIHTAVGEPFVGNVLVLDGEIAGVGDVASPGEVYEIDGTGKHLAPGIVDCHSHMAIERGINEATLSITADVDISDSVDADDLTIYRALAGGVTTARLLHGSANAIGGRHEVIKMKWGRTADELRFDGAPEGIKFALGENPKRSRRRFPNTRMGVEAIFDRAFGRAREYRAEWAAFERGESSVRPRRDIRLDALVGVLDGTIDVHSHCYRADEILMLLRVAERYGFRIKTLQHVLEGYKVAKEIADHGAGGSTFGDWWAYKFEAYDAIPHNAALMDEAGVLSSVNSDSDEMVRRLPGEAAKSVRYAGMDRVRALGLVTLFPARQLGIADRVGSIEVEKDADLALYDGDPLSSLARVEWTMVDGEIEFTRRDAFELDERPPSVAQGLEAELDFAADLYDPEGGPATAIVGATLHPVTRPAIEDGGIVLQDGRIVRLGADVEVPSGATIVDATGRHVWPGLIALNTGLGLWEIGRVTETVDLGEVGGNQPDVRVTASMNAETAHIPVTRTNGVTRAQVAPLSGGPLRGQSAVIRLSGDTWEELARVDRDMLHLSYPTVSNTAEDKDEGEAVAELERLFDAARDHARLRRDAEEHGTPKPPFDRRLDALAPYAEGRKRIALHADNAQTILYALRFAEEQELDVVLFGLREGWKVAEAVAAAGFPAVVGPVLALPTSRFDPYDAAYANAAVLVRAGVDVALMSDDRQNPRNLAFHAAMAAAFGLPREEAVRAITYHPARVLGLEADFGSLAPGKVADVIVTDGDLLEITSAVERVFIDGRDQPMESRHTRFYEEYRARLQRLNAR